jgi:hypothetical protein
MTTTPRFNHVAMSVSGSVLDDTGRSAIVGFYNDVFGWEELPTMTKPGERLVLQAHRYDQFVFLVGSDQPMTCPRLDHFGMAVGSLDELQELYDRARRYGERDERVDLVDIQMEDFEVLQLHSFYVGYLLPMMVEVQYWDWVRTDAPPDRAAAPG